MSRWADEDSGDGRVDAWRKSAAEASFLVFETFSKWKRQVQLVPAGSALPGERLLSASHLPAVTITATITATGRTWESGAHVLSTSLLSGRWFFVLRRTRALLSGHVTPVVWVLHGGAPSDEHLFFHLEERSLTRREDSVCASSHFS